MRSTEFVRRMWSETDGTPSNTRVMLFLLLSTAIGMIVGVVMAPLFLPPGVVLKLPEIPETFSSFIIWMTGILMTGGTIGKGITAYKDKGASSTTTTTSTEVKGVVVDESPK